MRKLKVYLDTSIINFVTADDAIEYRNITREFLDNYFTDYAIYISEVVLFEIQKTADENRRKVLFDTISKYKLEVFEPLNDEIEKLADLYVENDIIPRNKMEDALHLGFSTFFEFDILLSWNFKHLANIKKEIQINSINSLNGYEKKLNLMNPMEVIYEK